MSESRPTGSSQEGVTLAQIRAEQKTGAAFQSANMDRQFITMLGQPADAASTEFSFGPFRLLPVQFLLLEGDRPVSIGSRALEILIVLLQRAGELVSKQELTDCVWPDLIVSPANLTVNVSALRRTLRDGKEGNRFIINIPGRGYKFVAPIVDPKKNNPASETVNRPCFPRQGPGYADYTFVRHVAATANARRVPYPFHARQGDSHDATQAALPQRGVRHRQS